MPVRGTWMKFWGIRKEELFRDAEENRNREEKPRLVRLDTLIPEFRTREGKDSPLYVLSYEQRPYGAVWMTDPDVLRLAGASLGSSYFILPSSVHECLLLPDTGEYETVYLNWLVREVNRTQLQPEEVLADHIYRYDRHSDVLRCCY